ncbi:GerAB/ArcD/ProY family transporter [Paenibacillus bouchesdurhonensis]|uniref:GerAB/ArcD/ProY family transporter n=1 Tax=Paenibacillus bouchesdurhonensis TaxID=1870990 RepID=UPI000DA63084|nr:GerAB/ArcD/ProY family transporter [Paenibacillus bouchesdurhonensis]
MEKIKITPLQVFALMLLFQLGTALVVNLGLEVHKDEWLAILLGLAIGLLLYAANSMLYLWFPKMLPTEYFKILLGKYLGTLLGIVYTVFFLNKASRDLLDGGLLVISSTLRETPLFIVNLLMMITVAYTLHKGLEVLARTALIFMVIIVVIGMLSLLLIGFANIIDINRLLPILGDGIGPLLQSVPRKNYQFPFAEAIAFNMLLPFLNDAKKGVRAGYLAIVFAGFILSLTVAMTISVLGVDIAERSLFPLLATIGKASISDFIQRPDIFVVMTLIIGVFFKISIYFYAALVGISNIFNIPYQKLIYPLTLIVLASTAWLTRSTSEHLMKGSKVLYLVDPIFYIVLPLVVLIAAMVYKLISRLRAGTGAASGAGGGGTASGGGTGAEASSRAGDETAGGGAGTGGAAGS